MPRKELQNELEIREQELLEELEITKKLLDSLRVPESNGSPSSISAERERTISFFGKPKGKTNWDDYVKYVLKEIGQGKARNVADAIVQANKGKNITPKRALDVARNHLSKLLKAGKIKATKGTVQSKGYVYRSK